MNRILVVPDDLLDLDLEGSFLDRRSSAIRTAANAEEALNTAESWKPQLVVFSGNLPGDTGENTICYSCGEPLIERWGYHISKNVITDGKCPKCDAGIDGLELLL